MEHCLQGLENERVILVPDFLAEGYFTRQVIPAKLGLAGEAHNNVAAKVVCSPPVGSHPMMAELLADAAKGLLHGWDPAETSLLVIGHGSGKNPCSKQTLLTHMEQVRAATAFAQASDLWLEEEPQVADWKELALCRQVIIVPFLINDGQHGGWDIPRELGLVDDARVHAQTHQLAGYELRVAPALGTSPRVVDVIRDYVRLWGQG